jgi:hypothetical protein
MAEAALTQCDLFTADGRMIGDGKPGAVMKNISKLFSEEAKRAYTAGVYSQTDLAVIMLRV